VIGVKGAAACCAGNERAMMTLSSRGDPMPTFKAAFESDANLQQYGPLALALFALGLHLRLDDIDEFAANATTEGPGDKKVDIFYLDLNERRAVVCQAYHASQWARPAAPANKASDLNAAMAWLLSASESDIPNSLRSRALDLRRAIAQSEIDRIDLLYVHNCHESENVDNELRVAAGATRDMIRTLIGQRDSPMVVSCKEIGLESIEDLYRARDSEILVDGWISIPTADSIIEEHGDGWEAIMTSVPGSWLQGLYKQHGDRLFTANYRDYLGSTRRKGNINYEITQTAEAEPANFWVYNNGVTALTYELQRSPSLQIRGISVINGAQTTGALSDASQTAAAALRVPIRFVQCSSRELIDKIIQFNNTQNEIRPSDRRSNDSIQRMLREGFAESGVTYVHRRSGTRSARNAIAASTIAPALAAFHGEPQIAYRNAREIFNDDDVYARVFPRTISAQHVFVVRALSVAIDNVKVQLKRKADDGTATSLEEDQLQVLKFSASKHFLFFIVGCLAEEIMSRRVSDLFGWKCVPGVLAPDNHSLTDAWETALRALLPQIATIVKPYGTDAFYEVPRSADKSKDVSTKLRALMASLGPVLGSQFDPIRQRTTV
jgi:hypothetical protein